MGSTNYKFYLRLNRNLVERVVMLCSFSAISYFFLFLSLFLIFFWFRKQCNLEKILGKIKIGGKKRRILIIEKKGIKTGHITTNNLQSDVHVNEGKRKQMKEDWQKDWKRERAYEVQDSLVQKLGNTWQPAIQVEEINNWVLQQQQKRKRTLKKNPTQSLELDLFILYIVQYNNPDSCKNTFSLHSYW